ncbi:hypothetical protein O181_000224 [Austropuccinia psidii MF-1]|uniref:G-patch domain-containing protein n=1 Tax=Austropuccinia psidii MF-1 TaxID=1389203 RepID=A0A9Q3GAQ1_9BASI|nr:hypothetical protein [Austropuccinia psidii MF-1]
MSGNDSRQVAFSSVHTNPPESESERKQEDDEEEDFMSDTFITNIPQSDAGQFGAAKTYSEQRKRKLLENAARSQKRSRAEREIEAREKGLEHDLIDSHFAQDKEGMPAATHSKAVQMMLKMGFKPGTSLGASTPEKANSPINIAPRAGRSGIGLLPSLPASKRRILFDSKSQPTLSKEESLQRDEFLERSRARFDGRKVQGILSRVCRTCEDLDRRRGLEFNVLWLGESPDEESTNTLSKLVSEADEKLESSEGEREEEVWLALDPSARLAFTLEYLRKEYWYCFWKRIIEKNCQICFWFHPSQVYVFKHFRLRRLHYHPASLNIRPIILPWRSGCFPKLLYDIKKDHSQLLFSFLPTPNRSSTTHLECHIWILLKQTARHKMWMPLFFCKYVSNYQSIFVFYH